jgi:hypothetical protein
MDQTTVHFWTLATHSLLVLLLRSRGKEFYLQQKSLLTGRIFKMMEIVGSR